MVGSQLTRYRKTEPFLIFDIEGESLNLGFSRPWQLAYAVATLQSGIQSVRSVMIRWPKLHMTDDNPSFAHFDPARYEREARDPREVWAEFSPLLGKHRAAGHNLLGYDADIVALWQRALGLKLSYDWLYSPPVLDTNAVSKAYRGQWTPDTSSPEAFVAWQYKCYHTFLPKGTKTKLGDMCREFGVEYDEKRAHDAEYDIRANWSMLKELVGRVEV